MSTNRKRDKSVHPWVVLRRDLPTPEWEGEHGPLRLYWLLFVLLRISPTYELARKASIGRLSPADHASIPLDFEQVQATFKVLGDVRQVFFAEWWRTRGVHAFGALEPPQVRQIGYIQSLESPTEQNLLAGLEMYCTQERVEDGMPETLLLAVPLGRRDVIAEIERVLDTYQKYLRPVAPRFQLQKSGSKIDSNYLARGVGRLLHRAMSDKRLWEVEAKCRPATDPWVMGVNPGVWNVAKGSREDECRRNLAQTLNRYLRTFERYAENAARGRFPSDADVPYTKYSYPSIGRRLERIRRWELAKKDRLPPKLARVV